jgi:hypothetical protein
MCTNTTILSTTFLQYQCLHGLGHGLMIFSADQLPWALSMCSKLDNGWSQQSCSGGVFMENFNQSPAMPFKSSYVKQRDLLYPCDWVQTKYKFYCYLQVTQHILSATGYDWKRTASICATAKYPWNGICYQSLGRDASGASQYKPARAYDYCRLATRVADCVFGAVRDFTNNDVGGTRAARLCDLVQPTAVRGYCFYGIGTILQTFGHSTAWIASTCRSLSRQFEPECTGTLTDPERRLITVVPSLSQVVAPALSKGA